MWSLFVSILCNVLQGLINIVKCMQELKQEKCKQCESIKELQPTNSGVWF